MKKKMLIVFGIVAIIIIGVGGKVYMDKREEKKEQDLLAVEKQSVKALKNTFVDISEVDIERTGYNGMTGSYRMLVTMKNNEGKSVYFSYGFVKDSGEIGDYGVEDERIQKEGVTDKKIKVIYSNGEEDEI